jgi:peroxiredoxin
MSEIENAPNAPSRWSGALRSIVLPAAILAAIIGGLLYWDSRGGGGAGSDAYGLVELPDAKNPTDRSPLGEVGRAAPDFVLERPEGGTLRLSDLQGRPLVLNFWASWCSPCRREMPELQTAFETYEEQGLQIVAVNLQETNGKVRDFTDEFGITFPTVIDRDGELPDAYRLGGPVRGIPSTYFIDATGVIRDRFFGPLTKDFLEERVDKILPGASG